MRCLHPLAILVDGRREFVPCGKCNFCLQSRRADWTFRLRQELKIAHSAKFLTLTYSEECMPIKDGKGILMKSDLQDFIKRLRYHSKERVDWPLRYYAVGEYGSKTVRPHYHAIMFNCFPEVLCKASEHWKQGIVHFGDVTTASIHYVTKYVVTRHNDYGDLPPPFVLCHVGPGLELII